MVYNFSLAVHALPIRMLTLLSIDELLLPRYANCFTNFKELPLNYTILIKTQAQTFILVHL